MVSRIDLALGPWAGSDQSSIAFATLLALTPIPPPFSWTLLWTSSISKNLVLSAEVTGASGADADNQARERLVLASVLIA